ncbi:GDP-L-fucose synthase [Elusimicrobium posterum]|uniref:NAD-dependent epimerase/dehydratase family protein n=1 Tax=Elusimicrobium posterum TaxID=3116653 RepID=UPI003C77F83E
MTKKILLTGANGFIGRHVLSYLKEEGYTPDTPGRAVLNVNDADSVDTFLKENKYDILLHFANISPGTNPVDKTENILEYTLRGFANFAKHADKFEKIIYSGSGAEYDKRFDIKSVAEEDIGRTIPADAYGLAKYINNLVTRGSKNIYNLRIFGCYGPYDVKTKFIRDAVDCVLQGQPITIRQNCFFDYLYVQDYARIVKHFIENEPSFHDYNVCTGKRISLYEIAEIVNRQMGSNAGIIVAKEGLNKEYSAANNRLLSEIPDFKFTNIEDGIAKQIAWQKEI